MRIAVIGSGIAGNAAAWALAPHHGVVLYEKDLRPGGHSHTVDVEIDGARIAVDTGFIVYNAPNYPNFTALLAELGVASEASNMSFALSLGGGRLEWSGQSLDSVFAQRTNALSPGFLHMLADVVRFNREAPAARRAGILAGLTLGDWLIRRRFSRRFRDHYIVPMGAAIWSTPLDRLLDFPAESFVQFFENHRLVNYSQIPWRTVSGGSRRYVEAMHRRLKGRVRLGTPAVAVRRTAQGVEVTDASGHVDRFDQIVLATHAPEALAMLADASEAERAVLGAIRYRANTAVLHRDPRLMPKRRKVWAAWNVVGSAPAAADGAPDVSVTYWMNRLQNLDPARPVFVSLNPPQAPADDLTFARFSYEHPQYDTAAIAAQRRLPDIQGVNRVWFAGAWAGYGFHEDGLAAGLSVAEALGAVIPWRSTPAHIAVAAE